MIDGGEENETGKSKGQINRERIEAFKAAQLKYGTKSSPPASVGEGEDTKRRKAELELRQIQQKDSTAETTGRSQVLPGSIEEFALILNVEPSLVNGAKDYRTTRDTAIEGWKESGGISLDPIEQAAIPGYSEFGVEPYDVSKVLKKYAEETGDKKLLGMLSGSEALRTANDRLEKMFKGKATPSIAHVDFPKDIIKPGDVIPPDGFLFMYHPLKIKPEVCRGIIEGRWRGELVRTLGNSELLSQCKDKAPSVHDGIQRAYQTSVAPLPSELIHVK